MAKKRTSKRLSWKIVEKLEGYVTDIDEKEGTCCIKLWNKKGAETEPVFKLADCKLKGISVTGQPVKYTVYRAGPDVMARLEPLCTPSEMERVVLLDIDPESFKGLEESH